MKKAIWFFSTILILLFISFGCSSDDKSVSSDPGSGSTETSFNFTLTSYKKQETASSVLGRLANFTADQVMTGQLTATNTATSAVQTFDWSIYFDETTFAVQSNKTIILPPGTYDFALLLTKGDQQYAGAVAGQAISDGTFDVPMTIRPIIGGSITNVSLVGSLADFKFQYDVAELATAGFIAPQLGVILDGGTEVIFGINPATGISDSYINLAAGSHGIQLKLYDGSIQRGRSIAAQETVIVSPGLNIAMDLVALHGETTFALDAAGGNATFNFTIPAEVVSEAGGLSNLEVVFSMVGPKNLVEENALNLTQAGSDYQSQITLTNKQFDNVTLSLTFNDLSKSPKEQLGLCSQVTTLNTTERTVSCNLTLRRRAIIGGNLLATLGINVLNEAGEPVAGATVSQGGTLLGVTGSGAFGTVGYLKVYLNAGDYTIKAEGTEKYGESSISLSPLSVVNQDIILNLVNGPSNSILLADTGQTTCYDAAGVVITCPAAGQSFAQDGSYPRNPQSFTDNGDGTVTDNNTKRMWQKEDDNTVRALVSATSYCHDLTFANHTDWRLPNIKELNSIVDYSTSFPAINGIFPDTNIDQNWWSSNLYTFTDNPNAAWSMSFGYGSVHYSTKTYQYYVRCIRDGSESDIWPLDFTVIGDGTVVHQSTGLTWQQADDDTTKTWEEATLYCEGLTLADKNEWRLPNVRELLSIVNYSINNPITGTEFSGTNSSVYWTSTTFADNTINAFGLDFFKGQAWGYAKTNSYYVRCVQGG